MPAFDFNDWRARGRPIPWCTKDRKHVRLDLDPTREIGMKCAECGSDLKYEVAVRDDKEPSRASGT